VPAAISFLHDEPAAGAPLPLHPGGHLEQHHVLPTPVVLPEPPVLVAGQAQVPRRHAAPRAEEAPAHLALALRNAPLGVALVRHHQLGAVRKRAVRAPLAEEHGLAERGAPPLEHVGGERRAAELRVQRGGAGRVGAPHGGGGLDLGADVARQARAAEGVRALSAAAVGFRGRRHGLHADAAGGLLPGLGCRHWRRLAAAAPCRVSLSLSLRRVPQSSFAGIMTIRIRESVRLSWVRLGFKGQPFCS
jgi:hypothetical protein